MYVVYWSTISSGSQGSVHRTAHSESYLSSEMSFALCHAESLRKRARNGEPICFITLVSENPDCVGQMGVDVTGPDYNWMKRRDQ